MEKQDYSINWHEISHEEVLRKLEAKKTGLSRQESKQRLKEFGKNALEKEEQQSIIELFIHELNNPLIYLLLIASLLSFFVGHVVDATVILLIVVMNATLGIWQSYRAEKAIAALKELTAIKANVVRDGKLKKINAENVVPGDLVEIETGDVIPADLRLIETNDLEIDESSLTGESMPVQKIEKECEADAPLAERKNMAYMSSPVTQGKGKGVVVATGKHTETGKIASEVRSTQRELTPVQKRFEDLAKYIGVFAVSFAVLIFMLGYFKGHGLMNMLLYSVAASVSAIPEGLPAVISISLALGVKRMADRKAIIRRLPAVETLGSTTVICCDKTGTITKNEMAVQKLFAGEKEYSIENFDKNVALEQLSLIGFYANNAHRTEKGSVEGDPTDVAILKFSLSSEFQESMKKHRRIAEIPFTSERGYMAILCEQSDQRVIFIKGAPENILAFSDYKISGDQSGEQNKLTEEDKQKLFDVSEAFSKDALRVIAGAYKVIDKNTIEDADVQEGLIFVGFWGILDPPREESAQAIEACKSAGIKVIMQTGDNPLTAAAIATMVGIHQAKEKVYTGNDVESSSEEELSQIVRDARVFARVSPSHKLKVLNSLKKEGEVVAMTGDGVNDAPALKGAHIGVAMGIEGTEVAKEAADMVLMDDNFATIVSAIEEGRLIFRNLRNVVFFLVTTNLGEIIFLLSTLILNFPLPLTPIMILWINLVTDGPCVIALGIEPKHFDLLKAKPRPKDEHILNRSLLIRIPILASVMAFGTLYLFWNSFNEHEITHARTVAFTSLTMYQWLNALNARSEKLSIFSFPFLSNPWLLYAICFTFILQLSVIYLPLGQFLFGTEPLTGLEWLWIMLFATSIIFVDECIKMTLYGRSPLKS
ncbi:MAG: cation-transporting P-type ATPase [Chlamydiales bacterium]